MNCVFNVSSNQQFHCSEKSDQFPYCYVVCINSYKNLFISFHHRYHMIEFRKTVAFSCVHTHTHIRARFLFCYI